MGCRVRPSQHGTLAFRVIWNGNRSWEGTGLPDTVANRKHLQPRSDLINAEIRAGIFDAARYLHYFPVGSLAARLRVPVAEPEVHVPSIGECYPEWMEQHQPPAIRRSLYRDRRNIFNRYIIPLLGYLPITDLTRDYLLQLQHDLLRTRKLSPKTARTIIDAVFRAFYRDMRARYPTLLAGDPFATLTWPRVPQKPPDPLEELERDALLEYFRDAKPREYPFLATLFFTGMRPSEAAALRWSALDSRRRTLEITVSRYLDENNPTKTTASTRTIRIPEFIARVITQMRPAVARPDDYVFRSRAGTPIDQSEWPKTHWRPSLAALGLRHRKFYNTRHTYISLALTYNANIKHLADHCGTSIAMIEKHYGRFLGGGSLDPLSAAMAKRLSESETFHSGSDTSSEKPPSVPEHTETSPTGFEPVLPT